MIGTHWTYDSLPLVIYTVVAIAYCPSQNLILFDDGDEVNLDLLEGNFHLSKSHAPVFLCDARFPVHLFWQFKHRYDNNGIRTDPDGSRHYDESTAFVVYRHNDNLYIRPEHEFKELFSEHNRTA